MKTLPVTIRIEKEHIMGADMFSTDFCAVARGMTEAVPLADRIEVGYDDALFFPIGAKRWDEVHSVRLPLHVGNFIRCLTLCDRLHLRFLRRFFKPFSFEIQVREDMVAVEPQRPKPVYSPAPREVASRRVAVG